LSASVSVQRGIDDALDFVGEERHASTL